MENNIKLKIDGTSKIDIKKVDFNAQACNFSGSVNNHLTKSGTEKERFEIILIQPDKFQILTINKENKT
jgi:hypothetical protein